MQYCNSHSTIPLTVTVLKAMSERPFVAIAAVGRTMGWLLGPIFSGVQDGCGDMPELEHRIQCFKAVYHTVQGSGFRVPFYPPTWRKPPI